MIAIAAIIGSTGPASVHPHVFAEARLDVTVNPDQTVKSLRNLWRFDDVFSSTVLMEFDKNSDLIVVLDGSAQITTFGGEPISTVGPGSIVGEVSLVDDQPRSATIRSVQFTETAVIPAAKLSTLIESNPAIGATVYKNIAQTLCSRLRHSTIHLDGLMGKNV